MPVADTELLFALNPKDRKYDKIFNKISKLRRIPLN